jgi:hypothetical protein
MEARVCPFINRLAAIGQFNCRRANFRLTFRQKNLLNQGCSVPTGHKAESFSESGYWIAGNQGEKVFPMKA